MTLAAADLSALRLTAALASTLNSAATLFTMDFARKFRPKMDNKGQVLAGNISGLVIIIIAALWAPQIHMRTSDEAFPPSTGRS